MPGANAIADKTSASMSSAVPIPFLTALWIVSLAMVDAFLDALSSNYDCINKNSPHVGNASRK